MNKPPKVIILHDYFLYKGGGERLVISMAKGLNCPVATAFIGKDAFDPRDYGVETIELYKESRFSRIPGFRYMQVQFNFLFKTRFLKDYDVVIYSGDCLAALLNATGKRNIAYMHTPPRHLYDSYQDRINSYGILKKLVFIPFAIFNRWRFSTLSKRFDLILTNSVNVQERITQYLNLPSQVVYPPCTTLPFKHISDGDYYLSWARLYPAKRVDMLVEAFTKMPDKKLIVASGGPELEKVQQIAAGHPNIEIRGWVSDQDLIDLLGNCIATAYIPVREDFGMSPVESMVAGKPVIGVAEGGLLEIIEDNVNGIFIKPNFTTADIVEAVNKLTPELARQMRKACEATASKFTEEAFVAQIKAAIEA
jgi:glycosyltransferase involved in cell wall biosynthesis